MEYRQPLSKRAFECLTLLKYLGLEEIESQKGNENLEKIGAGADTIIRQSGFSQSVFRNLMRDELYGLSGVFYQHLIKSKPWAQTYAVPQNIWDTKLNQTCAVRVELIGQNKKLETIVEPKPFLLNSKNKSRHIKPIGFYIPESTNQEINETLDMEEPVFVKDIYPSSLPVLEHVFNKSNELKEKHGINWYPLFSNEDISKEISMSLRKVESATDNLTGVLCEAYRVEEKGAWQKMYFLPTAKDRFVINALS